MAATLDILAVGIAAVDDILYIDDAPTLNGKYPVRNTTRHAGGLAATAMAAAARLGGAVSYVARLDAGELSRFMTTSCIDYGVQTRHMIRDPAAQPYHSVIVVDAATGSRTIFYDCRNFQQPQPADLADDLIRSAKLFFLDFLAEPVPLELARKVRRLGVPIVADIEGRSGAVGALLELVDYLVVSEEFAQWKTGQRDLAQACARLAAHPRKATVVTAGAQGCYWTDSPARPVTHQPAFPVLTTDTTGCGDTYHGAFAYALSQNWTVQEAILLASACGALKASGQGGWPALPTRAAAKDFLAARQATHPAIAPLVAKLAQ
jgi:sulfofructose kinase